MLLLVPLFARQGISAKNLSRENSDLNPIIQGWSYATVRLHTRLVRLELLGALHLMQKRLIKYVRTCHDSRYNVLRILHLERI